MNIKQKSWGILLLCLALLAGAYLGYLRFQSPRAESVEEVPVALEQAKEGPDFQLMLSDLKIMSKEVHSVDSEGLHAMHAYLLERLTALGYEPKEERYSLTMEEILALHQARCDFRGKPMEETEEFIREYSGIGDKPTMELNNISVLIPAENTEETIVFMAHTDSVKMGPGTFDDTVSVAALLESLRLMQGVTPQRNLLFLFTDGEEQGLLGAFKYLESHPEMKEKTALVLNLEARGNHGALIMFETSKNNLAMVKTLNEAVQRPVSTSIATAVYRTMRNDTDLTPFFMRDIPGMNFAVIENAKVYHTPEDNYQTFSRDSARVYLDTAASLVKYFATAENIQVQSDEEGVFFPLLGDKLVVLSQRVANGLSFGAGILSLGLMALYMMRRRVRLSRVLLSFVYYLLFLTATYFVCLGLVEIVHALHNFEEGQSMIGSSLSTPLFLLMALMSGGLGFTLMYRHKKSVTPLENALGALLLPAILCLALPFLFPAGSYLFFGITYLALFALVLTRLFPRAGLLWSMAAGFGMMLRIAPISYLVYVALTFYNAHLAVTLLMLPILTLGAVAGSERRQNA